MAQPPTLFLTGIIVGFISAVIGGYVDFRLSKSRPDEQQRLPGCIFLTTGGLGFAGVVAVIATWLMAGDVGRPLIVGGGVISGFFIGFMLLFTAWMLRNRR